MIDFAMAHPFYAVVMAWLGVIGLGHVAGIVKEAVRQPFLFYSHIAEGRRIRKHRAEMRLIYDRAGPAGQAQVAREFAAVDETLSAFRKVPA